MPPNKAHTHTNTNTHTNTQTNTQTQTHLSLQALITGSWLGAVEIEAVL